MNIAPNSTIKILRGVPLDPTYEHTIYFNSLQDQYNYFNGKVKPTSGGVSFTLTEQTYQRVNLSSISCGILADKLYDCNYLMFKNTNFGDKWFYAFISNVEYVNNSVSNITYEIDVMQTWMHDYSLGQCFVDREHSESDEIGSNTVPENLNIGEYVYIDAGKSFNISDDPVGSGFNLVICAAFEPKEIIDGIWVFTDAEPAYYGAQYSGLKYTTFPLTNSTDIDLFFTSLNSILGATRKQEIVSIMIVPNFISTSPNLIAPVPNLSVKNEQIAKYYDWTNGDANYSGYVPKNHKLYTYPFNTLYVTSSDGDSAYYKYEMFENSYLNCDFKLTGATQAPPELALTPIGYCYPINKTQPNYNFSLYVKNFPMCPWTTDTFKAWLAQNATRIVANVGLSVASGQVAIGSIKAGTEMWMARAKGTSEVPLKTVQQKEQAWGERQQDVRNMATVTAVASSLLEITSAALQPDQTHGVNGASMSMECDEFGYHYYYARVKDEYAAIIDDYFTKFGYATKRVKVPNISARPYWNYVKTIGCILDNNRLPGDAEDKICSIYDRGITFWKYSPADANFAVGNYSRDNQPNVG